MLIQSIVSVCPRDEHSAPIDVPTEAILVACQNVVPACKVHEGLRVKAREETRIHLGHVLHVHMAITVQIQGSMLAHPYYTCVTTNCASKWISMKT